MRRRARRLHLKCRPKVERTTFRHSLIRRDRRARSSRIGAKNAERDGSATTYESTGIVCSGASNSFGGAMMIFFDGASRCVCCDVSASSQKNEDFYLFSQIKGWYLSEKVPHKVLSSSEPQKVLFKETPTSLRNHRPRRLSTFFAFKKEKKKREEEEKKRRKKKNGKRRRRGGGDFWARRLHFFLRAHPKRHSCNSFRNYSWPSGR